MDVGVDQKAQGARCSCGGADDMCPCQNTPDTVALNAILRRELASRAVRLMGPQSPFWNCTLCGAAHLTPIAFEHKPGCIIASERPKALVSDGGPQSFHSIEVQHAIMRDALEAIAELNHGTTGQVARAVLDAIAKATA